MNPLIINKTISKMIAGYPTVSDKYNVAGGTLAGTTEAAFGQLLMYGDYTGYYKVATALTAVTQIAGPLLATNVKLATVWPASSAAVTTKVGEQLNLMLDGYIALQIDAGATVASIAEGKQVAVVLATGVLTTIDKVATGIVALPGYFFTGMYQGDSTAGYVAEVHIIATH